jgi:hypothetical protein
VPAEARISYLTADTWAPDLPSYDQIAYEQPWPGVDIAYERAPRGLKSTYIVAPGADPSVIALAWHGTDAVRIGADSALEISTAAGTLRETAPLAWQDRPDGGRDLVAAHWAEAGVDADGLPAFGFAVGQYDPARPLVIDPLLYGTFLGGSGIDVALGIAADAAGNAYLTGFTTSANFPTTVGTDRSLNGNTDVVVVKMRADGTGLAYAGLIGGSGDDEGYGIAVDGSGNAYVTGRTASTNFPTAVGPDLSYNDSPRDAFVVKVRADGSGPAYAGFIGGSGGDEGRGIAVDGAGNAYVTGLTSSADFPTVGSLDPSYNGYDTDAFVAKVRADGTGLAYAGFIGGSGTDVGSGIAVDGAGNAYVVGSTGSANFPPQGGPDLTFNDGVSGLDAFVVKVRADGNGLVYGGFIGGSGLDNGYSVAVDGAGHAFVAGGTTSTDFPTVGGPDASHNGGYLDAFVAKVRVDGSGLDYAGFIGGSGFDEGYGVAVDGTGNAYVTGVTSSANFPSVGGLASKQNVGSDAFVAKVRPDGTSLAYAGVVGGSDYDVGHGIAVDSVGNAYLTGETYSTDFPAVGGPYPDQNGGADGFLVKIGPSADATPPACGSPTTGTDAQGHKTLSVKVRDTGNGIAGQGMKTVEVTKLTNATIALSPSPSSTSGSARTYTPPTTAAVTVTATKIDEALSSQLALKLTDASGNVTNCDPVSLSVGRNTGKPDTMMLTGISHAESTLTVVNATPGLTQLDVVVNGQGFKLTPLRDGETRTLDVSSAMKPGTANTIALSARGKPGGGADVLVSDAPAAGGAGGSGARPNGR